MDNYVQIDIVLQCIILFPIYVFHSKPDFTRRSIQKYFDLLVCQINISTANCEQAAAVNFDRWIVVLKEAVQFFVSEKVKPQKPLEPHNPMPNVLPGPDTFYLMCFIASNDDMIS